MESGTVDQAGNVDGVSKATWLVVLGTPLAACPNKCILVPLPSGALDNCLGLPNG